MFNMVYLYFLDIEQLRKALLTVQTEADVPSLMGRSTLFFYTHKGIYTNKIKV